jgi:cardiolipin synthase
VCMIIPLFFTGLRFVLTPVIMYYIAHAQCVYAFIVFACAACTDFLDGLSARYLHQETQVGALLDPLADKVLISGVLYALWMYTGYVPTWFVCLVVIKELLLIAGTVLLLQKKYDVSVQPIFAAKVTMFLQCVYVMGICMQYHIQLMQGLLIMCALLHVYVLGVYATRLQKMKVM